MERRGWKLVFQTSVAAEFFDNLLEFRKSRALQDSLHAEHFPLRHIEQLAEVKGDETQYADGGHTPVASPPPRHIHEVRTAHEG